MLPSRSLWDRCAFYCAAGSACFALISIAVCQVLLVAAVLFLLLARRKLGMPPVVLPLALFCAGTILAVLVSSDPQAGLPQIRKFFVFLFLPVIYTCFVETGQILGVLWAWIATASASGMWAAVQFWQKREAALALHQNFYQAYIGERVTGFMSHWMTFSAEMMIVLSLLLAVLCFAKVKHKILLIVPAALISLGLTIALTRSVWLATVCSILYLVAAWRPRWLLLFPVLAFVGWAAAPSSVRERVVSVYKPHGRMDSNEHREITRRAGMEMIKEHPLLGIGPEIVGRDFETYLPSDVQKPLPTGFYGHLHNIYLQYAAERGVPVLLALLWLIGKVVWDFARGLRETINAHSAKGALLHGAIAVVIAIMAEGFFEHNLGDSEVLSVFLIIIAWGYSTLREAALSDAGPRQPA